MRLGRESAKDLASRQHRKDREMEKDLVCGMVVDPKTAAGKSEYEGKTYYFCSPGCKVAFDRDPERYVKEAGSTPEHGHAHH